ncbi:hypothetical protein [Caulobacter mirabilis]|uniref:Uncharacterized protein n=1 Tax=Caulobacter mirabilis TaxID=69666 RepID=A0A2D2B0Q3_9CAUL|nr:hypothetical protein [Caulobacter mirabilis]ATQ43828.1 hypothetical protein CSW64_16210 [Caulobacter mirabilis]
MQAALLLLTLLGSADAAVESPPLQPLPMEELAGATAGAAPARAVSIVRRDDGVALRITLDGSTRSLSPSLSNLAVNSDPASVVQAQLRLAVDVKLDLGR